MEQKSNGDERGFDGDPLTERGTAERQPRPEPDTGDAQNPDAGEDNDFPVDESDDGPAPFIRAEDAKNE